MKKPLAKLYFVEGEKIVFYPDRWLLDFDNYTQQITIHDARQLLSRFGLKETEDFVDWYRYTNYRMEAHVCLKPEENFYDDKETQIKDVKYYITLIDIIMVLIYRPLTESDLEILRTIMDTFHLKIYHVESKTHCNSKEEVRHVLQAVNLYIDS